MDKLFSWKVLVSFCAVFIVTWIALQTVSIMRLEAEAEEIADGIFSWNWPNAHWQSTAEMTHATVVQKSANAAVIKVSGKQRITAKIRGEELDNSPGRSETVDCSVVVTLYRNHDKWVLGRVEL